MKKIIFLLFIFGIYFIPSVSFGAITYTRNTTGTNVTLPVSITISLSTLQDLWEFTPPENFFWSLMLFASHEGYDGEYAYFTGDCVSSSELSHTFNFTQNEFSRGSDWHDNVTLTYPSLISRITIGASELLSDCESSSNLYNNGGGGAENFTGDTFTIIIPVTVTVDANQTKVYGASEPVAFTYTSSDGAATFTGALSRAAGENVGTYAITQNTLSAGGNYDITFIPGTLTVTQASSTTLITCPVSETYTGSVLTPCSATVTGAGGLNQAETVNYTANTNVGTATATATFAGDANHAGSTDTKTFAITVAQYSGGGGFPILPSVTPTVPVGQVLGASTGPIPGCGNRTTGFSVATGESCVGNSTGQVLGAAAFNFTKLMKNGSKGNEITELQKFLNNLGHNCGTADGKFGPKTKSCVIKYQLANKLKGDGVVGALTRAFLNQ